MRIYVVVGIIGFLCAISIMIHCDAPDPDSGACKNRVRLFALPSEILADGISSSLIQAIIKNEFGEDIRIDINAVKEIEREASGKLRYFVSEVK